jgi:hypothetical protein
MGFTAAHGPVFRRVAAHTASTLSLVSLGENRPVAQSPRISSFASTRLRTKTSGSGSSIGK